MTTTPELGRWDALLAARTRGEVGDGIASVLAFLGVPELISFAGIPIESARDIVKHLKDLKMKKVQAAIQGDQVRVSSASKDDLQSAMGALKARDFGVALQFGNYR